MDKDTVIAKLRENEDALRAAGATRLSIFGSVARGDSTPASDLDVLVALSEPIMHSGFGYFGAVQNLRDLVVTITGVDSVDVVTEPLQKERLRRNVERDLVNAF